MDAFLGSLMLVPYNFAPRGWLFCQGQILPISQYTALFSLIGTTYGGDGKATFAIPDLRANVITDANGTALSWVIALQGIYPSRD
jgi:microcystin-dependent protein